MKEGSIWLRYEKGVALSGFIKLYYILQKNLQFKKVSSDSVL